MAVPRAAGKFRCDLRKTRALCFAVLDAPAVLRAIHSVRQYSYFCACMVAVFPVQHALRAATASGICDFCAARDFFPGSIRHENSASRTFIANLDEYSNRVDNFAVGSLNLCCDLAFRSHLLQRSQAEYEDPLSARPPAWGLAQIPSAEFHAADVFGRARWRSGARRDSLEQDD